MISRKCLLPTCAGTHSTVVVNDDRSLLGVILSSQRMVVIGLGTAGQVIRNGIVDGALRQCDVVTRQCSLFDFLGSHQQFFLDPQDEGTTDSGGMTVAVITLPYRGGHGQCGILQNVGRNLAFLWLRLKEPVQRHAKTNRGRNDVGANHDIKIIGNHLFLARATRRGSCCHQVTPGLEESISEGFCC